MKDSKNKSVKTFDDETYFLQHFSDIADELNKKLSIYNRDFIFIV